MSQQESNAVSKVSQNEDIKRLQEDVKEFQLESSESLDLLREHFLEEMAVQTESQRRQWLGMSHALTTMAGGGVPNLGDG